MCHYEISGKSRYSGWRKRYSKYMKLGSKLRAFYKEQGALATVNISSRNDGILRVTGGGSYDPEEDPGITALVIGAEQYNMILRQLDNDTP